ncbi:ABC transporter substrate-binding protein [Timonella senegalensis]|uniref:ABC transporter substrate-binding protein n=1 Tax=Timonella senegalensis TaxID=1465825 RepID=UPI0028B0EF70|nr:extracellular solute-binding protein [Timonella senegalensis]
MRAPRRTARLAAAGLALTFALTACSSGSSDDSSAPTTDSTTAGEKVNLDFWTWAPNMDKVVALWNEENPDIQVTVNKQDGGDGAMTKFLTAIKAGSGAPDLMQAEYQVIPTLVSSDALADISGYVTDETKADFAEGVWNSVTLGTDAVYSIPQDAGPMMFFYRADVFKDLGIDVPTTWDEYADAARKIHEADSDVYLGTFSANDAGWFTGLATQAGASWWSMDASAGSWGVHVDEEPTQKVAKYWGDLVEEGVINNKPMYTPEWNAALNDGTEVGWLSAVWAPGVLSGNAPDTAGKWEVAAMPQWDASSPATGSWGGSSTAVSTQSKHPDAAAKFATWLNTDPDAVAAMVKEAGIYPASLSASTSALTEAPEFFSNQPDFYTVAAEVSATTKSFTFGPNVNTAYSAYKDEFGKATEKKSSSAFLEAVTNIQKIVVDDMTNTGFTVK